MDGSGRHMLGVPKIETAPRVHPYRGPRGHVVLAFFDGTQRLHFELRQWTAPILRQFLNVGAAVEGQLDLMGTPQQR